MSILLYGCTTQTLTKGIDKKLEGNCTMLQAILNKTWKQHPTKQQLYGHRPFISKTIQIRQTRHMGHCWRSKEELISDVLQWNPSHGRAGVKRPARTYVQQIYTNTGCSREDLPEVMNEDELQVKVREMRASGTTWWWWWWFLLERRMRGNLIKTFKMINGISNYGRHFHKISIRTGNLLSRQISKTKSTNQLDLFFGTNC